MNKYFGFSNEIIKLVAQEIIDRIDDFEDCELSDLAMEMFNNEYYMVGTKKAKSFISKYIDDMFVLNEYVNDILGQDLIFKDPEMLVVILILSVAEVIIGTLDHTEEYNIELIKQELEKLL